MPPPPPPPPPPPSPPPLLRAARRQLPAAGVCPAANWHAGDRSQPASAR
eukprot:COSAG06_NODE_2427_length_6899_cov_2.921912_2_plen_49_part_00